MSLQERIKQVLVVISENLNTPQPQLISSNTLAEKLQLQLADIRSLLKHMDGLGVIKTDPDLQHSLITRKGLTWLVNRGVYKKSDLESIKTIPYKFS